MLKKECRDILIQSLFFAIAMVALPAVIDLTGIIPKQPYIAIFMPAFQCGLLFWALFMGVSLFSYERGQKGMEYLLSLPYSRLQMLGIKILPRFLSILFFFLIFLMIYFLGGRDFVALALFSFTFLYFVLFYISLCLSPLSDNFLVLSLVSLFTLAIFSEVLFLLAWLLMRMAGITYFAWSEINSTFLSLQWEAESELSFPVMVLAAVLILLPLGLAMVLSFKKFDVRPSKIYGRRFFKFLAPLLIAGILCAALADWIGIDRGSRDYYLTQDKKLVVSTYLSTKIYDGDSVLSVKDQFFPYFYWDTPPYLYSYDWGNGMFKLNTATAAAELIYREPKLPRRRFWEYFRRFIYENTIVFIEPGRAADEIQLVLIDDKTKKTTRIPFRHDFFKDRGGPKILATTIRDGQRSWLACFPYSTKHPVRLWQDGRVDDVKYKDELLEKSSTQYINGMLFLTNSDGITILREQDNVFVVAKKFPKEDKPWYWMWNRLSDNPENIRIKEFYGRRVDRLFRFDLETLELEDIGEWKKIVGGYWIGLQFIPPDEFYFTETDDRERTINIFKLEGRTKILLKTFEDFDFQQKKNGFEIFKSGVIIQRGNKVQVYSLPDFQEIRYKKLG